jgi:hypothetical protein
MDSTDLARRRRGLRLAYELGRARIALLGILPAVVIVAAAASVTHRPRSALAFGAATVAAGAILLWYGREPRRAVLPGIAAGLVPLVLALCANHYHACGGDACTTLCVPACTLGGVVAGLAVAIIGHRRRAGVRYWLSASGLALATGAMGCACVGYSGVVGLALGFGAGVLPGALRRALSGWRGGAHP